MHSQSQHDLRSISKQGDTSNSCPTPTPSTRSELMPTMQDLHSLTWDNGGKLEQLKVIEMCSSKHKCEDLSRILGQPESHLSSSVKEVSSSCCQAMFQRWLVWGSMPKEAYPITWQGLVNMLKDTGLEDDAKQLEKALFMRNQ